MSEIFIVLREYDICFAGSWFFAGKSNIVKIVEVFAIVSSEAKQRTANHSRCVSSARFWGGFVLRFDALESVGAGVEDDDVIGVSRGTNSPCKDVYFVIIDIAGMPPSFQMLIIVYESFPNKPAGLMLLEEGCKVHPMHVSYEFVVIFATANNIEAIVNETSAMKPSSLWA